MIKSKKLSVFVKLFTVILGAFLIVEGYKMTRLTYYLSIGGSQPDDYTAGGQFMIVVGVLLFVLILIHTFRHNSKNKD